MVERVSRVESDGVEASVEDKLGTAVGVGEEAPDGEALFIGDGELAPEATAVSLPRTETEGECDAVALSKCVRVPALERDAHDDAEADTDPPADGVPLALPTEAVGCALALADFDCTADLDSDADGSDDGDALVLADVEPLGEPDDADDREERTDADA